MEKKGLNIAREKNIRFCYTLNKIYYLVDSIKLFIIESTIYNLFDLTKTDLFS